MSHTYEYTEYMHETDVLILGAGASGCGAALAASEKNIRVLLTDKGKLESCGSVGGGNDHYMAVLNTEEQADKVEDMVKFYCTPTSGYSPSQIEQWVETMPHFINVLKDLGVNFLHNEDGSFYRTTGFGQPGSWWTHINNGKYIKRRFASLIRSKGVDILEYFFCTKILTENGNVVGALGFNVLDGSFHCIKAKSIVLALGRTNCRATSNSTHMPFNTAFSPFITGSQVALAYDAGAQIITLDSEQEATLIPKGWGCPGMNGITSSGAKAMNAINERYMKKYHPMLEVGPRSLLIQGTHREFVAGNGPPFDLDLTHIDKDILHHLQYESMPGDKETWIDYCEQAEIDLSTKPMEVELSELYINGIILLDDKFESYTVKGLFSGSLFNDFSGALCSGYISGKHASTQAFENKSSFVGISEECILEEKERVFAPLFVEEGISQKRFEGCIQQTMEYYMGFVRSEQGIQRGIEKLDFIEEYAKELMAANLHELLRAHESLHLLKLCQLTSLATKERRETGTCIYRRADYPEPNPDLAKLLLVYKEKNEAKLMWR